MELNQIHATSTSAFDGIENLFKFLKDRDIKISIWTGREISSAKKILEHVGLLKYVNLCVGRTCVEKNKPYPDGLLKILSGIDLNYSVKIVFLDWQGIGFHGSQLFARELKAQGIESMGVVLDGSCFPAWGQN